MYHLTLIQILTIVLPTTSIYITRFFFIELIFKWAMMLQFGFFLQIAFNASPSLFAGVSFVLLIYGSFFWFCSISQHGKGPKIYLLQPILSKLVTEFNQKLEMLHNHTFFKKNSSKDSFWEVCYPPG